MEEAISEKAASAQGSNLEQEGQGHVLEPSQAPQPPKEGPSTTMSLSLSL